jgi:hypothetical protein
MATEELKRQKSVYIDQVPAQTVKAGGRTMCSEIHRLIYSILNRKKLPDQWKESLCLFKRIRYNRTK